MSTLPTVSIAMGTFNGARFLKQQLESLTKQSVMPTELVVVDDASSDESFSILTEFAARSPFPVRLTRNDVRLGYRENFMKAAALCQSQIIAFCDQDDIWLAHKLNSTLALFGAHDTLLVYHNALVTDKDLVPITDLTSRGARHRINPPHTTDPWTYGLGFTLVFDRGLLGYMALWPLSVDFNEPDQREAHDQWFFFLASSLGSVGYVKEPLVFYRQHGANTCGWQEQASWWRTMFNNLAATTIRDLEMRQKVAQRRSEILDRITLMERGFKQENASAGANGYRRLAKLYRARQKLYRARARLFKVGRLIALTVRHGYRGKEKWGLGLQALVRDFICGVIFPRQTGINQTQGHKKSSDEDHPSELS